MEKKVYLSPKMCEVESEGLTLLVESVTRVDGTEDDIDYGGGGSGAGCIKERDPWKEGLWTEDEPTEDSNKLSESIW